MRRNIGIMKNVGIDEGVAKLLRRAKRITGMTYKEIVRRAVALLLSTYKESKP